MAKPQTLMSTCIFVIVLLSPWRSASASEVEFDRDVYSVFRKHCFECHGSKVQRSGLRLDQRSAARQGGDGGPAWTKTSEKSELVRRLRLPGDDAEAMPPLGESRPNSKQVEAVASWIDAGAPWPDDAHGADAPSDVTTASHPVLKGDAHSLDFKKQVLPFLKHYCYDCHDTKSREAGFDLYRAAEQDFDVDLRRWNSKWEKVSRSIVSGSMPHPKQKRQPNQAERALFGRWFEHELERRSTPDTSRPSNARLRQLTAREYDNTVRDLTGLDLHPSRIVYPGGVPADSGFLNQGREMVLSPSRLVRYLQSANEIAKHAIVSSKKGILWSETPAKPPAAEAPPDSSTFHDPIRDHLLAFARRAYRRPLSDEEAASLTGLYDDHIAKGVDPQTACRQVLQGILSAPQVVYVAEDFQGEYKDIRWDDKKRKRSEATFPLTHHEVATRLSYFLWATMPDAELTRLADEGKLHDEKVIEAQVRRMLKDKRSASLATEFAGYWLKLNKLTDHLDINRQRFPALTDSLRQAMYDEARLFFEEIIAKDRSVLLLLDADFTYVNAELADLYGIPAPDGPGLGRVKLTGDHHRGGLLGMAGVLSLTSHPDRHSAVERGVYVLRELLGIPPLPPPDDAGELDDVEVNGKNLTMRETLERHRANSHCAGCHNRIDPLGFALDRFDAIGRYRENNEESSMPIDAASTLPDGTTIEGLAGLKRYLLTGDRKRRFVKQFARQLMQYALTRELESGDFHTLAAMRRAFEENDYRPSAAIAVLVTSNVFLSRAEE